MDLDKEYYKQPDLLLVTIINEWLGTEQLRSFHIDYPRDNDTIAWGLEGWLKFNHHSDGYSTIATVYNKSVYLDYEDVSIEASDPEFFTKLKAALRRHEVIHQGCKKC